MLCLKHTPLLDFTLIASFVCVGTLGALSGLAVSPTISSAEIYIGLVLALALVLAYADGYTTDTAASAAAAPLVPSAVRRAAVRRAPGAATTSATYLLMGAFAFFGGVLTASVGFGADFALYTFGHALWNLLLPHRFLSHQVLSASSVVTMASLSCITAAARAFTDGISRSALECWAAAAWVVCIGAPVGSLLLRGQSSSARRSLRQKVERLALHLLALFQAVLFATWQPPPPEFWAALASLGVGLVGLLAAHQRCLLHRTDDLERPGRSRIE